MESSKAWSNAKPKVVKSYIIELRAIELYIKALKIEKPISLFCFLSFR